MSTRANRMTIIIFALITAAVHLVILNLAFFTGKGHLDILFALNGIGFLALLGALLYDIPPGMSGLVRWVFIGYTAVTIVAWFVLNGNFGDPLSLVTKVDEVLLIAALLKYKS